MQRLLRVPVRPVSFHKPAVHALIGLRSAPFSTSLPDLPFTDKCPEPYCECEATPEGLDIDHESPLLGTVPAYDMHLLVHDNRPTWSSKFEDDDTVAAKVKKAFSRGGRFQHVCLSSRHH